MIIALFTDNFTNLHYNKIQREHEAISGYFVILPEITSHSCSIALFTDNIYICITMKLNTNARQFRAKMTE